MDTIKFLLYTLDELSFRRIKFRQLCQKKDFNLQTISNITKNYSANIVGDLYYPS